MPSSKIFIDIGSFKGEEIKWALEHGYQVHAFEPNPRMRPFLEKYENLAKINYAAAWNRTGMIKLFEKNVEWDSDMGLSVIGDKTNINKDSFIEVPCINIGKYLEGLGRDIDILKIDAEGAEYIIIESILTHVNPSKIKRWLVEDHGGLIFDWHDHKHKILDKLKKKEVIIEDWVGMT